MSGNTPPDHDQRALLTHQVLRVLHAWDLDHGDQLTLLGMPEGTRPRALKRFRDGEPLPSDPKVMQRVERLLQIDQALGSLFPHNPVLGDLWITTQSPRFEHRAPLELMLGQGLPAMRAIVDHLYGTDDGW